MSDPFVIPAILLVSFIAHQGTTMVPKDRVIKVVNECVKEQVELCGDLICEGDWTPEIVIQGTGQAINWCLEDL